MKNMLNTIMQTIAAIALIVCITVYTNSAGSTEQALLAGSPPLTAGASSQTENIYTYMTATHADSAEYEFTGSSVGAPEFIYTNPHIDAPYQYKPNEYTILYSYSEEWTETKLYGLYNELLNNRHGEEIKTLKEIIVYAGASRGGYDGIYIANTADTELMTIHPAFPDDYTVRLPSKTGKIELYNGDKYNSVESIARILSHEYGHHFTYYYMFPYYTRKSRLIETGEYAGIRKVKEYDLSSAGQRNKEFTKIIEVAADDYVQIFGSPNARRTVQYTDIRQQVENGKYPDNYSWGIYPQKNMLIPTAAETRGLFEYFGGLLGIDTPGIEPKKEITLNITKEEQQFRLAGKEFIYTHYIVTWDAPYKDAIYTLVWHDADVTKYKGWAQPVKTTTAANSSAYIGEYAALKNGQLVHGDDGIAKGEKVFMVIALLPGESGIYYKSEGLYYDFG